MKILVAVDLESPWQALDLALKFAPAGSTVTLMHAVELPPEGMPARTSIATPDMVAKLEKDAERHLADLAKAHARASIELKTMLRRGEAAEQIMTAAVENNVDLIVVGTHGRVGAERLLLGSVAENVIRHAPRPVLVAR